MQTGRTLLHIWGINESFIWKSPSERCSLEKRRHSEPSQAQKNIHPLTLPLVHLLWPLLRWFLHTHLHSRGPNEVAAPEGAWCVHGTFLTYCMKLKYRGILLCNRILDDYSWKQGISLVEVVMLLGCSSQVCTSRLSFSSDSSSLSLIANLDPLQPLSWALLYLFWCSDVTYRVFAKHFLPICRITYHNLATSASLVIKLDRNS